MCAVTMLARCVTGGVALLGLVAWLVLVPKVDPVEWSGARA